MITPRIHRPTADQVQRCTLHNKNAVFNLFIFKSKCLNPLIRKIHTIPWLNKAWHSSNDSTVRPFGIWYFNIILYSPSWLTETYISWNQCSHTTCITMNDLTDLLSHVTGRVRQEDVDGTIFTPFYRVPTMTWGLQNRNSFCFYPIGRGYKRRVKF